MLVAVPAEIRAGERRVAASPETTAKLVKLGWDVRVQSGAGLASGFADDLGMSFGGNSVTYETGAAAAVGSVSGGDTYYLSIDGATANADVAVADAIDTLVAAARRSSTARR